MICLQCDSTSFATVPDAVIEQLFKGKTLFVQTPASVCLKCGWIICDNDQADELCRRTLEAYNLKT